MDDEERKDVLVGLVDEVVLFELSCDFLFVVDEERIELVGHQFWFLVEGNGLC